MWRMEDVLSELKDEGTGAENEKGGLAPGFRFHPTDEELITFYLASKVFNHPTAATTSSCSLFSRSAIDIAEVDLNRCEPWDLPERAKMGEREWYFYSLRDRKYPTGLRTNRATGSGYWKATGKDRQVYTNSTTATGRRGRGTSTATATATATTTAGALIGMKKTLVFYQGRAPRGVKTRWVMHEYRLDGHFSSFRLSSKEEWVICRIFQKHGEGEKKHSPNINHPSLTSSLSPFLGCLPPLLETPTTSSSTSPAALALDSLSQPPARHQEHTNFLLNSLLNHSSSLPFSTSSSSESFPFPLTATSVDPSHPTMFSDSKPFHHLLPPIKHHRPSEYTTATANATDIATDIAVPKGGNNEEQQHWVDKICPQIQTEGQYPCYPMLSYDELDPTNSYSRGGVDGDASVHVDMSASMAALDRMLPLHSPIKLTAESWPFHT